MGSPELPQPIAGPDEELKGEDIDPGHFYAAYIFDQPESHDEDITTIVTKARALGHPVRYWWLSDAMELGDVPDRLIVCVHHESFSTDAGMGLYRALKEEEISWNELEAASFAEYLQYGRFIRNIEDLHTPGGSKLFPDKNPVEPTQLNSREPLPLVQLHWEDVQAAARTHFGRDLTETELGVVAPHIQRIVETQIDWPNTLREALTDCRALGLIDETTDSVEATFAAWMGEVDEVVKDVVGCSVADLPDIDYRTLFEAGTTTYEAASEALLNAGFGRF